MWFEPQPALTPQGKPRNAGLSCLEERRRGSVIPHCLPSSMKITRLRAQPAEHPAQVLEVARDQVLDAVDLLPAPAHRKQGGIETHLSPALRAAWPDDPVDRAVRVLNRAAQRAAGRFRALALRDDTDAMHVASAP